MSNTAKAEIFCTIDQQWFEYEGGTIIPPDVIGNRSSCGHVLPVNADVREVEQPEPEPVPNETQKKELEALQNAVGSNK